MITQKEKKVLAVGDEIYLPFEACEYLGFAYYNDTIEEKVLPANVLIEALSQKYQDIGARSCYGFLLENPNAIYLVQSTRKPSLGWFNFFVA